MNIIVTGRHLEVTPALKDYAEKKIARANCKGERSWNNVAPKRARSPTLRTICVPVSNSQAVESSTSSAATYTARAI